MAVPASSVRANWRSSRPIDAQDLVSTLREVGYASPIDSMTTLAVSTMNGSVRPRSRRAGPRDGRCAAGRSRGPRSTAARRRAIDERHRARVVGDDLVAEALRLERVRIVAEELAHPRVDGREQVGVVVRAAPAGRRSPAARGPCPVSTLGNGSGVATVGLLVELHEHEVPDLEPARAVLASGRARSPGPPRGARRGRSGSRCTARTDRCRPSARSSCRRPCRHRPSGPSAPAAARSRRARSSHATSSSV